MNPKFFVALLVGLLCLGNFIVKAQYFPDTIVLKSGQHLEGKITAESEQSVTISMDASTGKTERTIPKSDISSIFRAPPPTPTPRPKVPPTPGAFSPDKKWQYISGDSPKLMKAGTDEVAIDFSDNCNLGGSSPASKITWAPDSKRLAFFSCGSGKELLTLIYQLQDDHWVASKTPGDGDEIGDATTRIIDKQAKKDGLPKHTFLHMMWWKVEPRQWLDSNTLILFTSETEVVHRNNGEFVGPSYEGKMLFTLKFNAAGEWKIVERHEMTGKAAAAPDATAPLADEVLFRSPGGSYHIQVSADGSALWIVPEKDPSQRKPLLGADPDDRSPEDFTGSPDDKWLFDNRQQELYQDKGGFVFSPVNKKQWLWKGALDYAVNQFHFARKDIAEECVRWSFDSARLLIDFDDDNDQRFVYFNTRTKAFEQTPYLTAVNAKLKAGKPFQGFPDAQFAGDHRSSYLVFAEPIDPPPAEAILKPRFAALDQEMHRLNGEPYATDGWNKARDEAVQLYAPFAPDAERENRKLQFLCDLTQREVNGLKQRDTE